VTPTAHLELSFGISNHSASTGGELKDYRKMAGYSGCPHLDPIVKKRILTVNGIFSQETRHLGPIYLIAANPV
jgi:hypothetical protein